MLVAGIMTGTSVDAIDVAICNINHEGNRFAISLVYYVQAPYPTQLESAVKGALACTASMEELAALPFELSKAYAEAVVQAEKAAACRVEAVAVHGQTLWHIPAVATWQAVSGPALTALLGVPVVHDFRAGDIALGGQGAPLVPMFDLAVFGGAQSVVALNVGGMANITLLPANCTESDLRAFDTGPGNVLIDAACKKLFGKKFDANGSIARAGMVNQAALANLTSMQFFALDPPKSTGRELFGDALADSLCKQYAHPSIPSEDLIATLTEVTAWSIANHIVRYQPDTMQVIASGGGSRNGFLMERLAAHLYPITVVPSTNYGIDVDAKEAMAFAYLGYRTLHGFHSNIPSVTGASRAIVLGTVANTAAS